MGFEVEIENLKVRVSPAKCPSGEANITVDAVWPEPLEGVVEALALMLPPLKVTYSREFGSVTFKVRGRMVGVYSSGRVSFCARDIEEAKDTLRQLKALISEAKGRVMWGGAPDPATAESWSTLSALTLYRYMPKTNCKKCGELTCLAFAAKVLAGERRLGECPALKLSENRHLVEALEREYGRVALETLGWP